MDVEAPARWRTIQLWVGGLGALGLFLLSVQLLKSSVGALTPALEMFLPSLIRGDFSALGVGWVTAYLLLNGSVVAALAVTLFNAALISGPELLFMVFGSRLGAAGVVFVIGMIDFLQRRQITVRGASELGIVSFLVTHTIALPGLLVGDLLLGLAPLGVTYDGFGQPVRRLQIPSAIEWVADVVIGVLGPSLALVTAIFLLMASLHLFNTLFEVADFEYLRSRYGHLLHSRWRAFAIGLVLTSIATSIAFSIGVIVPIYNRRFVKREEVIPYILGANIGTFADTLLISLFVDVVGGMEVVLFVIAMTTLVTIPALLLFPLYRASIDALLEQIVAGRRSFALFLVSLLGAPLALVGIGWLLGS